jgi:diguanylate cyclase (GGDEF)-like protein/PAS domain S-box-containing protein
MVDEVHPAKTQILVVEDENIVALDIQNQLKRLGYAVQAIATSGEEAIHKAADASPDLILMDIKLKGALDGVEAAEQIRARFDIPVVFLTAYSDEATLQRAKVTKPFGYLLKPFQARELHTTIEMALYKHKMERRLRDSERWLAATLNGIGDAVIAADAEGCIKSLNPVAEALTGWKREEVLGKDLAKVFRRKEIVGTADENPAKKAVREGIVVGIVTHTLLAKDAREILIDGNAAPIEDEKGTITGAVLVFRDVTERVRAQETLQQRAGELSVLNTFGHQVSASLSLDEVVEAILEGIADCVALDLAMLYLRQGGELCLQGVYTENPEFARVGSEVKQVSQYLCGLAVSEQQPFYSSNIHTDPLCTLEECKRAGMHSFAALPLCHGDSVLGVLGVASTVERDFGKQAGFLEALAGEIAMGLQNALLHQQIQHHAAELQQEVTERLQAEEELRESEERFRNIFENSPIGIYRTTPDGRILMANSALVRMLGFSSFEELVGRNLENEGYHPSYPRTSFKQRIESEGRIIGLEAAWLRKDGSTLNVRENATAARDEHGNVLYYEGTVEDITRQVRAERLLRTLNQVALAMEKALTYEEIFMAVAKEFKKLGYSCLVLPMDESRSRLFTQYVSSEARALKAAEKLVGLEQKDFSFPIENVDAYKEVIWERKTVFIENGIDVMRQVVPKRVTRFAGQLVKMLKMPKAIAAPLIVDDEVIGVLSVQSDDLIEEDMSAITAFAHQVSAAWRKAQLFEQAQQEIAEGVQAEEKTRQRSRELALLNQIMATSAADLGPETVLEGACRELARFFELPYAAATLLNREKTEAVVVAEYRSESRPSVLNKIILVDDDPPFQYLLSFKAPLVVPGVGHYKSPTGLTTEDDHDRDPLRQHRVSSLVHFPLIIEGEVVGSLGLEPIESRSFSAREISLAWSVTDQVAGALARARLDEDRRRLSAAIEQAAESVIITDTKGTILYVNPAFERITGYGSAEVVGKNPRLLKSGRQDAALYAELWATIRAERSWHGLLINQKKDGALYTVDTTITPVRDEYGDIVNYVGIQRDITHELQLEEQYRQAQKDTLTGLPNRALFMEHLERSIQRAKGQKDYLFAVLFLDLDRFKVINDSLGHIVGDRLLIAIARRLEACVRFDDIVARFGGDEFAILLDNIKDHSDAIRVANRIQNDVALPVNLEGQRMFTTASIGIAMSETEYDRPVDFLRNADTAMYRAKALGQARCEVFDSSMHTQAVARWQLETDLRQAVERQEFRLYYQPFVSVASGEVVGSEALLRWQHPERGLVAPMEFIPLAEETGLIVPIGEWVLRTACAQVRAWQIAGYSHLRVAVNMSAYQFQEYHLTELVKEVLRETGLSPQALDLEITEGIAVIRDPGFAVLNELSEMGIRISLDDFGLGSSLSCLKNFPLNTVKIDQSFVRGMVSDLDDETIITAIIAMAHDLKLEVIAEGVETEEQLALLRAKQCDQIQGNLFSQPLPAGALTKLFQEGRSLYS